jgi:hypothetical protein
MKLATSPTTMGRRNIGQRGGFLRGGFRCCVEEDMGGWKGAWCFGVDVVEEVEEGWSYMV